MRVKVVVALIVGLIMLSVSAAVQAFDPHDISGATGSPMFEGRMQGCFSQAMVGMDSVINARLGVPAEHALGLTEQETSIDEALLGTPTFDEELLSTILTAYLWDGSPHGYAIKVFYECAASNTIMVEGSDFLP